MTNYDIARNAALKLNPSELIKLRTELTAMLALPHKGAREPQQDVDDARFGLWAIADELQRSGTEHDAMGRLSVHRDRAQFNKHYQAVNQYFTKAGLDKIQRRALFQIGLKLLYDNLTAMGIPVTSVTMMHHVHRVPAMINQQLPGYAESGLLHLVVGGKSHVRHQ